MVYHETNDRLARWNVLSLEPFAGVLFNLPFELNKWVFFVLFLQLVESDPGQVVLVHLHLDASDDPCWVNGDLVHDLLLVSVLAQEEGGLVSVGEYKLDSHESLCSFG